MSTSCTLKIKHLINTHLKTFTFIAFQAIKPGLKNNNRKTLNCLHLRKQVLFGNSYYASTLQNTDN